MDEAEDLANRYGLKVETVRDLLDSGWVHRSEYFSVPQFLHPAALPHKRNVFNEEIHG